MRVPLDWLREFVKYSGGTAALTESLTAAGTEVERVDQPPKLPETVRVGLVKTLVKHHAADRLVVVKVSLGRGPVRTIVCGAPNVAVGQRVPVVLPGTVLPNGMTVEAREVRGVRSQGMIASETELGIGEDGSGIVVLDGTAPLGVPLASVLKPSTVLELEVTPNRSDLLSVRGVAREVAAIQGLKLPPDPKGLPDHGANPPVAVSVREPKLAPLYTARLVRGVTVKPSPRWMQQRLRAVGITPRNVVVDVTNYVLMELGEPLHAFDAAKLGRIAGRPAIVVRRARTGERITTLDGVHRNLSASMLVIADTRHPVAVAGVMGGVESAVTERTRDVVLEAALFAPASIRATRRQLGLSTDASYRFERGVDAAVVPVALDRAARMLTELAGGTVVPGRAVRGAVPLPKAVTVSVGSTGRLLGMRLSGPTVVRALTAQGFTVERVGDRVRVTPPSWRYDVGIPAEVADEVGRMLGPTKLKPTRLSGPLVPLPLPWSHRLRRAAEDLAVAFGATELSLYAFQPRERAGVGKPLEIANPLNIEQQYLRTELAPALRTAAKHIARERSTTFVSEVGHVFRGGGSGLPREPVHQVLVRIANEPPLQNFRYLKAAANAVLRSVDGGTPAWSGGAEFAVHLAARAVGSGGMVVGEQGSEAWIELDLSALAKFSERPWRFISLPQYPAVKRDLSFYLPERVPFARVERFLNRAHPLLVDTEVFDAFERNGRRSVAVHLVFQSKERTLKNADVDPIVAELTRGLSERYGAEVR